MLKPNTLKPAKGSVKKMKRVARGTSSGHGKTGCRGHKGQTSRSGGTKGVRFEGGQTPLYRRLPKKRGFTSLFRKEYREINLNNLKDIKGEFKIEDMIKRGMLSADEKIKVLGEGEISGPLTVHAHKFTKSAQAKIEKAGGKIVQC